MLVSAQAVVVTLFGGVAAIWGPVIGAAILVPLAESLNAELGNYPAGHPGRGVRRGDHHHHAGGAGRSVLDDPRPLLPPRLATALPPVPATLPALARGPGVPDWRAAVAGGPDCRSSFGGLRAVSEVSFAVACRRDPRHHRTEWRRQDHAVQCAERRAARGSGQRHARRDSRCWAARCIRCAAWASAAPSRWCAAFRGCRCSTT